MATVIGNEGVLVSSNLTNWSRYSTPCTGSLRRLVFVNGQFWAVGGTTTSASSGNGVIIRSTYGTSWSTVQSNFSYPLVSISYANGYFIAVGIGALIIRSSNGTSWSTISSPGGISSTGNGNWLLHSIYTGDKFVVLGDYKRILTSTNNGSTWTSQYVDTSTNLNGAALTYGSGRYIVQWGNSTDFYLSTDLVNWEKTLSLSTNKYTTNHILYHAPKDMFICVGNSGAIYTSEVLPTQSILTFRNVLSDASPHYIDERTSIIIDPSKITSTDSNGNYYVEFDITNLKLVSAEISNVMSSIDKSTLYYNNLDITGSSSGSYLSWTTESYSESYTGTCYSTCYQTCYENYTGTCTGTRNTGGYYACGSTNYYIYNFEFGKAFTNGVYYAITTRGSGNWVDVPTRCRLDFYFPTSGGTIKLGSKQHTKSGAGWLYINASEMSGWQSGSGSSCLGGRGYETITLDYVSGGKPNRMDIMSTSSVCSNTETYTYSCTKSRSYSCNPYSCNSYSCTQYRTRYRAYIRNSKHRDLIYGLGSSIYKISSSSLSYSSPYYRYQTQSGLTSSSHSGTFAATLYDTPSVYCYDLIDFTTSPYSQRGYISSTFYGSRNYTTNAGWGLYIVSSGSGKLQTPYRGDMTVEFTCSPTVSSGTFAGTTAYRGSKYTKNISASDLTYNSSNNLYEIELSASNIVLLNVKLTSAEPTVNYTPSFSNARTINWRNVTISLPTDISLYSGSYGNYSTSTGYRTMNTSSFYPTLYNSGGYASDISHVFNANSKMFGNITMPDYSVADSSTYLTGCIRLFSPLTRSSSNKYTLLKPYSSSYNNIAAVWSTSFSLAKNRVLTANGYQGSSDTPTAGVKNLTTAACTKLRTTYGSDVRIYVIKYRRQTSSTHFPIYSRSVTYDTSDYSNIDNCATLSGGKTYFVSSESTLKSTLNTIANELKTWANYEKAKNVL
ncbi:MAG: hypothetical protein IJ730_04300 [Alphaproteobacteria bacterium]|nr:hypothetical protein [Alphaproteobacteria bacterium]